MVRNLFKLVVLGVMIVGGWAGVSMYEQSTGEARANKALAEERKKNDLLKEVVQRLQTDKRMARVIVTDQTEVDGRTETTLLFAEYARDGKTILPERRFTIEGKGAHVDALVVEFDGKYVEANEPLRGHAVAIFRRLFGDHQAPTAGFTLDSPGEVPDAYRSGNPVPDPAVAKFEQELWKDFWRLADDPAYRQQFGVKAAIGAGAFREEFKKGYVYTLTLSPTGGLKMVPEKMDPMWEKSLYERTNAGPTSRTKS